MGYITNITIKHREVQMKYQSTIFVDNELCAKLQSGEVTLQCGQWIQLAWCDKPSRWVGLTRGKSLWAVHYPVRMNQFSALCRGITRFQPTK